MILQKPFCHFSVDDVFDALIEVTDKGADFFTQPFFAFLKDLHDTFGINVDLYCMYEKVIDGKMRSLRDVSDSYKKLLKEHRWLRFGPHALNYDTPPYTQSPEEQMATFDEIYKEIFRFTGSNAGSSWVRLHCFSESYELAGYFHEKGVEALFSTDKDIVEYRIPEYLKDSFQKDGVVTYENMHFIRTHIRVENLANNHFTEEQIFRILDSLLVSPQFVILMTHECALVRPEVRVTLLSIMRYLKEMGIPSR